jgi:hypothetical protein
LVLDAYAEAAKPDSKRWTWREPSPYVAEQYRSLGASPQRDVCIVAVGSSGGAFEPMLMNVTGGRVTPSTIVVTPGTKLSFKNLDPFAHKLFLVGNNAWRAENQAPNASREWTAPNGSNRFEFRDELFPSVRAYVVIEPQATAFAYPQRDGTFTMNLGSGDYILKAFFGGKNVGKPVSIAVKDKTLDIKEPLNLAEGLESK